MSNSRDKRMQDAARDIDDGLSTLLGTLGSAISEMVARIEDGKSGTVTRDHVFESEKGPIRAQAGIRLRMGGLEHESTVDEPRPVNPKPTKSVSPSSVGKPIAYDLLEDDDDWVLTADIPGVAIEHLNISKDGTVLLIRTKGERRYHADVDLKAGFSVAHDQISLRNGILTLRIKKEEAE